MRSLRGRLVLGAVLWTFGLLAVSPVAIENSPTMWRTLSVAHAHDHLAVAIAIACMIAGFALVRGALRPIDKIRQRLSEVRRGAEDQLHGSYPAEVQPLVDDLNALLAHSRRVVTRATAKAGDLAHGLKTPLAVLSNEAERVAASTDPELGATIAQQVALMQRHVDYHLAHARAAASGTALHTQCAVAVSVDGLRRTLLRLHAQRDLQIAATVDPAHAFRGRREDLDEMLGNVIENACKWAASRIAIGSSLAGDRVIVTVEDDGPGLDPSMRASVLQRGVRADEAVPGSGLGLAIVRDLAELYEGAIALERSEMGGLRVRLELPGGSGAGRDFKAEG
jgi:signal transduction histidine kinase